MKEIDFAYDMGFKEAIEKVMAIIGEEPEDGLISHPWLVIQLKKLKVRSK